MWLQFIIVAKMLTDTGQICYKNVTQLSSQLAVDSRTLTKMLHKCVDHTKLEIESWDNPLIINIPNYTYWQELRDYTEWKANKKANKNANKNVTRPDQTRPDKTRPEHIYSQDIPFDEIINHLNQVTEKQYRSNSKNTKDKIQARWNEDFRLDDFKYVHAVKAEEWLNTDYAKFLRPETLYGNKFEGYRNQKPKQTQLGDKLSSNAKSVIDWLHKEGVKIEPKRQDQVR
jgi:uncharacterized phage protein (TIGR02220 family)